MAGVFSRRAQMLGQQMKNQAGMATKGAAGMLGVARWAQQHPMITTGAVIGGAALFSYGSSDTQAIPFGPTEQRERPGSLGDDKYDLGATGNLVFALHRLNQ